MKHILLLLFLFPFISSAQGKLPKDIKDSKTALSVATADNDSKEIQEKISENFKTLGIEIKEVFHTCERLDIQKEKGKNDVFSTDCKYVINIQQKLIHKEYSYLLIITDAGNSNIGQAHIHYIAAAKSISELFEIFSKDLLEPDSEIGQKTVFPCGR